MINTFTIQGDQSNILRLIFELSYFDFKTLMTSYEYIWPGSNF